MTSQLAQAAVAAAGLVVLLTGCANQPATTPSAAETATTPSAAPSSPVASPTPTDSPTPTETATAAPVSPTAPATDLSAHNASALVAIETAEKATEGTAFNLDWSRNRWEVELIAGNRIHEVYLSADGTSITKQESERAEAEDRALLRRAEVPMAQAITTVVEATPGAMLIEIDLDTRRGAVVWEVDVTVDNVRQRSYVDAVTGQVQ